MEPTFTAASRTLQRLAVPSFSQAYDRLLALARTGSLVDTFRQCFPEKWPNVGRLGLLDLDGERLLHLQQTAISAVAALFPVQEDYMDMLVQEDEPLMLHPDSCGFAWDDDWLGEVFQDPTQLMPDSALAMFFKVLWIATTQFVEEDGRNLWESMRAHFNWPCDLPQVGTGIDWNTFHDLLEAHDLGPFQRAVDVSLCDTGNLFLDASPEEYGYGVVMIPDFTAENILELKRLWAEAEGWLADYDTCLAQVTAEPSIYTRLAELWEQSCKPQTSPAKTLMAVFEDN